MIAQIADHAAADLEALFNGDAQTLHRGNRCGVMNGDLGGGFEELDYDSADAIELTVKFVSDWWKETIV